ncbi:hypothetical protein ColLi_08270 [Colletotrichum liriopes]|uniref:PD-(D/E)XK nuclease-like domain-containing protein n=1 Tax=Colletotrichum liriopes TaxID=708192 RepID=A0AA37GR45_9PEZI|nr:hypothetical protein ColLi_08270 [Colletotrichum liriopes]
MSILMRVDAYVTRWLAGLPDTTNTANVERRESLHCDPSSKKRRRSSSSRIPTPPASLRKDMDPEDDPFSGGPETPLTKKRRIDDPHATPQASYNSISQAPSVSTTSASSASGRSRKSSPTKAFTRLEISNPLKLRFDEFDGINTDYPIPEALQQVRIQLGAFSTNQRIIPRRDRTAAAPLVKGSPFPLTDMAYYDDDESCRYGRMVPVDEVRIITNNSRHCAMHRAAEVVWNTEVHHQILRCALRGNDGNVGSGLVNFTICTSALINRHIIHRGPSKMVDFCFYIDSNVASRSDPAVNDAVTELRAWSPSEAVNHTDFTMMRNHPIALSIESKKQAGNHDDATLQIGTWHAAQWRFLARIRASKGLTLDGLEFLPGLIVQGNDWFFVASTRRDDETTLWTEQPIGSTRSALGTYQVIRAVQYLAWWCQEIYWPWFKEHIFDLEPQST